MTVILDNLIEALRNELQQYGEMLARLDQQRTLAEHACGDVIHQSAAGITTQSEAIQMARKRRLSAQRDVALRLRLPDTSSLAQIVPCLPKPYQPLLLALVAENHALWDRVNQYASQNRMLIRRSLELMQEIMTSISIQPAASDTPSGRKGPRAKHSLAPR